MRRRHIEPVAAGRWREDAWDACCGPAELVKEAESPFEVPLDLGEWVAPATLRSWIDEEINKLRGANHRATGDQHNPSQAPQDLLVLLAFAYAQRLFGSTEIARACHADPAFRAVCEGQAPAAEELWRFRRKNQPLLERVLAGVFLRAVCERFQLHASLVTPELEEDLRCRAVERLNLASHIDGAGE